MIEGIPIWLFYVAVVLMLGSWMGLALLGSGTRATRPHRTFDLPTLPLMNHALHSRVFRFVMQALFAFLFLLAV